MKNILVFIFIYVFIFSQSVSASEICSDIFNPKSLITSNTFKNQSQKRTKQYRKQIQAAWSVESFKKAGDLLHEYWQETNTYQTRYKPMKDEKGLPIQDMESYQTRNLIPNQYRDYYRKNKDGNFEEDIKAIPNRFLSHNNQYENNAGAKSALRQVISLLIASPKNQSEALHEIKKALQQNHTDWLNRNSWAKGSYAEGVSLLSAELQITNAIPLKKLFFSYSNKEDVFHAQIGKALDQHILNLHTQRLERFKNDSAEDAYMKMLAEKGVKIQIDPVLEDFFNSKIKHKQLSQPTPNIKTTSASEIQEYYLSQLKSEVQKSLNIKDDFSLHAPSTAAGSGAQVFLVKSKLGAVVGALKIQSKSDGGLDELLSSLVVSRFLNDERKGVNYVKIADYGLLSDDSYFIIIEPAKIKDIDHWMSTSNSKELNRLILREVAKTTSSLHSSESAQNTSKETFQTFKGNSLYEVRKLKSFLKSDLLLQQGQTHEVPENLIRSVKNKIEKAVSDYEYDLEHNLNAFKPTTTHGDYHGGNLFFNDLYQITTIIDYGSVVWTMTKKNQPGTGDPANDLGRMLGHLVIEDLKAGKVGHGTSFKIKTFYKDYIDLQHIQKGSFEEMVLRRSVMFYINRYFIIQISDTNGKKFNSETHGQTELINNLINLWNEIDLYL